MDSRYLMNRYAISTILHLMYGDLIFGYYKQVVAGGDGWKTGDWLVNYQGGFIRRGFIGHVFYNVAQLGLPLKWVAFGFQSLIYLIVLNLVLYLYFRKERTASWAVLLFAPSFMLFPVYDNVGSFRKEILVFLAFSLLAFLYSRKRIHNIGLAFCSILYGVAVFSHELAAMVVPFFIYLIVSARKEGFVSAMAARVSIGAFLVTAALGLVLAIVFHGTSAQRDAICHSWTSQGLSQNLCERATLLWLGLGAKDGIHHVAIRLPRYLGYVPTFLLSLAPLGIACWWKRRLSLLILGLLGLLPLFAVAYDWGRWIHVYCFFVFVTLLAESTVQNWPTKRVPCLIALAYITTWHLPHSEGTMGPGLWVFLPDWIAKVSGVTYFPW